MKYKNTVLLSGYSQVNLGDDLFFRIVVERYPHTRFIFLASREYKKILSNFANVKIIDTSSLLYKVIFRLSLIVEAHSYFIPPTIISFLLKVKYNFSHVILVGGSMFQEEGDNDKGISLLKAYTYARRLFSKCNFSIIGCNFGPYSSSEYKENVARMFSMIDDVCFRDVVSYNLFKHIPSVRYANDIVFHMFVVPQMPKLKRIGISVIRLSDRTTLKYLQDNYRRKLIECINFYKMLGYKVTLISFCSHLGDEDEVKQLYSAIVDKQDIDIFCYKGDIDGALKLINSLECMIAARFHAVILSLIYKVKVFPIAYSNKTHDMLSNYYMWNDFYNFENFTNMSVEEIAKLFIADFEINRELNSQFKELDRSLS